MSDLVICCDGTWQDATDRSNVVRLYEALDLPPNRRKYVEGVGTGWLLDRLRGGVAGVGIDRDLLAGYRFLVDEFRPDDHIAVFGFSRGAYLARSLAGMVGTVGIVDRAALGGEALEAAVAAAYGRYKAHKADVRAARRAGQEASRGPVTDDALPLVYDPRSPDVPVAFVGVWDTVGALGIPSYLGIPDLLGSRERYEFLDVVLDRRIPHARHAVSLDEMRGPFRPTLWDESAAGAGQDIVQTWFPGDHCDVGGGHADRGLSDGALWWMIEQARAAIELPIADPAVRPDPVDGTLHGLGQGPFGAFGAVVEAATQPRPRATPLVDHTRPLPRRVADSAYERQRARAGRPAGQQYRPTRTLGVGDAVEVVVEAHRSWNATGLYLEPGTYHFTAAGRWGTPLGGGGPRGAARWPIVGDGFGRVVDLVEQGLRQVLDNPEAELVGARREAHEPLMALVGLVANEVTDAEGQVVVTPTGARLEDQKFVIGDDRQQAVDRAGYLWAYGNDAWGSYGNNHGQVVLTVRRLDDQPAPEPAAGERAGARR
ncbi:DUF2235 domain-containing protein [Actinomycetospora cinnamomea]|uniref:Putative alpha/beta hydrolase family protein DUF2235 n=1 Tax=Actinomycetospora cinnamomea TaxID=663609 RepID=A0A2U1EZK0_9PSEU|nr:DUF2235 domain-containing protein [Actinomycetospora cinnamomea]PVZ05364.1 putative alpha/beta hydrolase family protein DUF2235 [Actinomycetospora cinnamomea]